MNTNIPETRSHTVDAASTAPAAASRFNPLQQNRWLRRLLWALAIVLALWALLWAAIPPILKWQGEKQASEALGRKVSIGSVDFKPWSMELAINDLRVATADGAATQLAAKRVYADASMQSLFKMAPIIDALRLEQPQLTVTHLGGGRFDFDDVLMRLMKPSPPSPEPARFALYNMALTGGSIDFKDQPVGKTHTIRQLELALPFISSLSSDRKVKSQPRLALVLNGASLDSRAQTLPFVQTRETDAKLVFNQLDLSPYLPYWPAVLPVALKSAWLSADVTVDFAQPDKPQLRLSGPISVDRLRLDNTHAATPWLALQHAKVTLQDVQPLARKIHLSQIDLDAPQLQVRRLANGRIAVLQPDASANRATTATKSIATVAPADPHTAPNAAAQAKTEAAQPWTVVVDRVRLTHGDVQWTDDTVSPPAAARLSALQLDIDAAHWPPAAGDANASIATFALSSQVAPSSLFPTPASAAGQLKITGNVGGSAQRPRADAQANLTGVPLVLAAPYLKQSLVPQPQGLIDGDAQLQWQAGAGTQPAITHVKLKDAALRNFKLVNGKQTLTSWQALQLKDVDVDVAAQKVTLGQVTLNQPDLEVERRADGRLVQQDWIKTAPPAKETTHASGKPWQVMLNQLNIRGGKLRWRDAAVPTPVALDVTALDLQLSHLQLSPWPAKDAGKGTVKPSPLTLFARVGNGRMEPGKLNWQGTLGPEPVSLHGKLQATRLPVHALQPYVDQQINVDIQRADLGYSGQVDFDQTPKGPQVKLAGDATLEDFRAHSVRVASVAAPAAAASGTAAVPAGAASAPVSAAAAVVAKALDTSTAAAAASASPSSVASTLGGGGDALASRTRSTSGGRLGQELLNWKLLQIKGLDVRVQPGQQTQVTVKNTLLSDFYARVILQENARFNLQDLFKPATNVPDPAATPAPSASVTVANTAVTTGPVAPAPPKAGAASAPAVAASGTAAVAAADANAPTAIIHFGPIQVQKGQVAFSDRFIKPNYSADLTELKGQLGAFSSVPVNGAVQMADLNLTGRAQGSAQLDINGKLNPLAKPLALDITGKVRELELPPLSTYSVRYAGHGIEKGKLSMDVNYKVQPSGQLTASNKLVLNQLTFGDKVEGAPASLPVKLAVALLADRNGVIDLDLPISGSLNDPQFRLAPIVFKVIGNIIMKAITAPFALLAGGGGSVSGPDLSHVPFAPGSARLTTEGKAALDKVVKLLSDRPTLQMSVTGLADLGVEQEAWRRERVRALVEAEKRRAAGSGKADAEVVVTDAEYPVLLKAVYKNADMKKPRNAVGIAKDLPTAEMEALLAANVRVGDNAMQQLALARGVAVKDYLMAQNMPADRLFLSAPKVDAAKLPPKEGEDKKPYTPHAKLDLTLK